MKMYLRKRNPARKQKVDPRDKPLTLEEAIAIAKIAWKWPGGLGEALVPSAKSQRGYKRDPEFHVFNKNYVPGKDVLLCPVMVVKLMRGHGNDYGAHLSVWRSIRNAYAELLLLTLDEAHNQYNHDLRNQPEVLAQNMERYIAHKYALSGTKNSSWYILYELVDDFGNYITPPELSLDAYHNRYTYFTDGDYTIDQWMQNLRLLRDQLLENADVGDYYA